VVRTKFDTGSSNRLSILSHCSGMLYPGPGQRADLGCAVWWTEQTVLELPCLESGTKQDGKEAGNVN